jgi:hypothetical protein
MSKLRQYDRSTILIEVILILYIFSYHGKVKVLRTMRVWVSKTPEIICEMCIMMPLHVASSMQLTDICMATDAPILKIIAREVFSSILYRVFSQILANRLRITSEELSRAKEEIERLKGESNL